MQILKTIKEISNQIVALKNKGKKVGFVPTMGALHAGHISLIRQSLSENDVTVCSIFINPTQFNDPKDFEKYPVTLDSDVALLTDVHCDFLFLPAVAEMYPRGTRQTHPIDFGFIAGTLEGEFRPGHFDGMAQIVEKLLLAVRPDHLYMGQKDYQQAMICAELIRKRKMKVILEVCPIKREKDGLAMSSRNMRLDRKSRTKAVEIVKTLRILKRQISILRSQFTSESPEADGSRIEEMQSAAKDRLAAFPEFRVEYVAIRDAKTLKPIRRFTSTTQAVALIAAHIGGVRLIDNMIL